jgi:hypothetical protein
MRTACCYFISYKNGLLQEASFTARNFVPFHLVIRPPQNVARLLWRCLVQAIVKKLKAG